MSLGLGVLSRGDAPLEVGLLGGAKELAPPHPELEDKRQAEERDQHDEQGIHDGLGGGKGQGKGCDGERIMMTRTLCMAAGQLRLPPFSSLLAHLHGGLADRVAWLDWQGPCLELVRDEALALPGAAHHHQPKHVLRDTSAEEG